MQLERTESKHLISKTKRCTSECTYHPLKTSKFCLLNLTAPQRYMGFIDHIRTHHPMASQPNFFASYPRANKVLCPFHHSSSLWKHSFLFKPAFSILHTILLSTKEDSTFLYCEASAFSYFWCKLKSEHYQNFPSPPFPEVFSWNLLWY